MSKNLANEISHIGYTLYSKSIADRLDTLIKDEHLYSRCKNISEKKQIELVNNWLRQALLLKPNTTELREWLVDDHSIDNYLMVLKTDHTLGKIIEVITA